MIRFENLNLDTNLMMSIYENGYTTPTEIQQKSIPHILDGNDLVGRSETGSGKTLAYLLPAIQKIDPNIFGVQVLILCPTRELVIQVYQELHNLLLSYGERTIKDVVIHGGVDFNKQIRMLKRGANIVIGTTGRLCDHLNRRTLKLDNLKMIILDEADEMMTMGFREDIELLLSKSPKNVQKVMFSATFPDSVRAIIKKYLHTPVYVEIGEENKSVSTVKQYFMFTKDKIASLKNILTAYKYEKFLIFANTKATVEKLYSEISKFADAKFIHGDIRQNERRIAINSFKTGRTNILIGTDIASRGIDIPSVYMVINFELPDEIEYYIHRIGRTARAGQEGFALTLISNSTGNQKIKALSNLINAEITEVEFKNNILVETENRYTNSNIKTNLWKTKEVDKKVNKSNKKQNAPRNIKHKKTKSNGYEFVTDMPNTNKNKSKFGDRKTNLNRKSNSYKNSSPKQKKGRYKK